MCATSIFTGRKGSLFLNALWNCGGALGVGPGEKFTSNKTAAIMFLFAPKIG
jgi:hypothetical protein